MNLAERACPDSDRQKMHSRSYTNVVIGEKYTAPSSGDITITSFLVSKKLSLTGKRSVLRGKVTIEPL